MCCGFVSDGYRRACQGVMPAVRAQVVAEYAARLDSAASPWRRFWLWCKIERDVRARFRKIAPADALY